VKRDFCAFAYSSVSRWKMEQWYAGGENCGNDSSCAQTSNSKSCRFLRDVCSPDLDVSHQIQTSQLPFRQIACFL